MNTIKQKGFTLIELLVVIAIIGTLSAVVLGAVNSARDKSAIASVKSNLSIMRTSAAILYSSSGSFDTLCDAGTNSGEQFRAAFTQSSKADNAILCLSSGTVVFRAISGAISATTKTATPDKWAASVQMKNGTYFCVDYSGIAREQATRGIDNSPADTDC